MERTDSKLGNYPHLGPAQGLVFELHFADRSRLLQVYLVGVGFPGGSLGGLFHQKKMVIFLWGFVMAQVAAMVLSFTIGKLRCSQSSRVAGLLLALRRIGSAMTSLSAASIEGFSGALHIDLVHETDVLDSVTFLFRATIWQSTFWWSHCPCIVSHRRETSLPV